LEIKAILSDSLHSVRMAREIFPPKNSVEVSALRWELYSAVQNLLDSMAMIVSDLGLRRPRSYADLGSVLYEEGFIDLKAHEDVKVVALTRNILAHAYRKLSIEDLGRIVNEVLPKVESLVMKLEEILKRKNIDPKIGEVGNLGAKLKRVFEKHRVILAYLFGSRAKEKFAEESDYDIAVLMEKQNPTLTDEISLAISIAETLGVPADKVDVVLLNKAEPPLKYRILREGKIIYCRSKELRKKWERETTIQYLDQQSLFKLKTKPKTSLNP